jgi:hypothetical protein
MMTDTTSAPLMDNEYVNEFLKIMRDNGKDAGGFVAMLGYVSSMEKQLNTAVEELTSMRRELSGMREERDHPVRTALQNAANLLETTINETRTRLEALKAKIIDGCKTAVAAFKEKGAAALNGIAKFFRLKPVFESLQNNLQNGIKHDKAVIAKIEAIGTKYHTAGMHLRNVGRTLRGKEPLTAPKPNGKLAKLAAAPFSAEIKCLQNALNDCGKAIDSLERLDVSVSNRAAERGEDKPSVKETMKTLAAKIEREKKDAPVTEKSKNIGVEL